MALDPNDAKKAMSLPLRFLNSCNPDPSKAGNTLLVLNVLGMISAAMCDTFAAAIDKDTPKEEKKFLVPAGVATGVAKIGLYYLMTDKIIKGLKKQAEKVVNDMNPVDLAKNAKEFAYSAVKKAEKGLFKKSDDYIKSMKETLFENGNVEGTIKDAAKTLYKNNVVAAGGVLGAFIGAVVGCSLITPIIRDVSAYFVQKKMDKVKPDSTSEDIKPFLDIANSRSLMAPEVQTKQPITMNNFMLSAKTGMKI